MQEKLLVVALLLSIVWLVVRIRRNKAETNRPPRPRPLDETTVYHAVSIKYSSNACDAAKEMTGRRFLSSAAPRLPLPDCDSLECRCQFSHHADRRTGKDRRSPFNPGAVPPGTGKYQVERRQQMDRRNSADHTDT